MSDAVDETPALKVVNLEGFTALHGPMRVLVVDDNRDAADTLGTVLSIAGAKVEVRYDGTSALSVANWFSPHVCVLDLTMPEMDGCELASLLRAQCGEKHVMLVALTAHGDATARVRTREAGFCIHFVKPADPLEIVVAIANVGWWLREKRG